MHIFKKVVNLWYFRNLEEIYTLVVNVCITLNTHAKENKTYDIYALQKINECLDY